MNAKIYNGNVQPNHKEYKIWVNDEGVIKTWNGTKWVELSGASSGGSGSGSGSDIIIEYYKIDRDAFESSTLGGEVWYPLFVNCESSFRQFVTGDGQYITSIGPADDSTADNYYKIALSNIPRYDDYNGTENFMDSKSPLENFARLIDNKYFPSGVEYILEMLNSFLIPITKEEYFTIDHLASYNIEN